MAHHEPNFWVKPPSHEDTGSIKKRRFGYAENLFTSLESGFVSLPLPGAKFGAQFWPDHDDDVFQFHMV